MATITALFAAKRGTASTIREMAVVRGIHGLFRDAQSMAEPLENRCFVLNGEAF